MGWSCLPAPGSLSRTYERLETGCDSLHEVCGRKSMFLRFISDWKLRVVLCRPGASTSWSGCSLNTEVSISLTSHFLWGKCTHVTPGTITVDGMFLMLSCTGCPPQIPDADAVAKCGTSVSVLQRLKGLSFAGRGISFSQTERMKEALRDLQHSLHVLPGTSALQRCVALDTTTELAC